MIRAILAGKVVVAKVVGETAEGVQIYITDATGGYHATIDKAAILGPATNPIKPTREEEEVSNPKRYTGRGKFECWDVIADQKMDFLEGNVVKYVWRHKEKNGVQDLKKAAEYLNKMIAEYETLYKSGKN